MAQATNIPAVERTVQLTNEWLGELQEALAVPERQHAYVALRATLHALRDRLAPAEAVQLGAQLPALVRGIYYDGWRLADRPFKIRDREEFLGLIRAEMRNARIPAEAAARAVFELLDRRVSDGEIRDVKAGLPPPIRGLWPRETAA